MARVYVLHQPQQATCPICGGFVACAGNGTMDLPKHARVAERNTPVKVNEHGGCPGSGMTVPIKNVPVKEKSSAAVPSDDDPFPFGTHRDVPYGKVPSSYLDWLIGQPWIRRWPTVLAYINANQKAIDKDLE